MLRLMTKLSTAMPFAAAALEAGAGVPLYRQLYDDIRRAILTGQLKAGTRLPSTPELAVDLRVSRNTVMNAFEQLLSEGYVEGHIGSGTYVSRTLPDELLNARAGVRGTRGTRATRRALSARG